MAKLGVSQENTYIHKYILQVILYLIRLHLPLLSPANKAKYIVSGQAFDEYL